MFNLVKKLIIWIERKFGAEIDENGKAHGVIITYFEKNIPYAKTIMNHGLRHGRHEAYYYNGGVHFHFNYKFGQKDGFFCVKSIHDRKGFFLNVV